LIFNGLKGVISQKTGLFKIRLVSAEEEEEIKKGRESNKFK
jgi:hypothetical protein